jgi:hypothetical protein
VYQLARIPKCTEQALSLSISKAVTLVSVDIAVLMAVEAHKEMAMNVSAGQKMIRSSVGTMGVQAAHWHQQEGVQMCAVLKSSNCLLERVPSATHGMEVGCA